jgi:hypothetical protein
MTRRDFAVWLLAGCIVTGCAGHSAGQQSSKHKGTSTVPPFELQLQASKREILFQESLDLRISLTNRGSQAVQAPDPSGGCPASFALMALHEDTALYSFSEAGYWMATDPNRSMRSETPMASLAPGSTFTYEADLGQLMTSAVLPGRYRVVASLALGGQSVESAAVELAILAPQVGLYSEFVTGTDDKLIALFSQKNRDGSVSLLERESASGAPWLGTAFRRTTLGAAPSTLAMAVNYAERLGGYWFAWLEEDRVGAGYGWGKGLNSIVPAVPTGLASPHLVERGRRLLDGRAAFLVAGLEGRQPALREFTYRYVPDPDEDKRPNPEIRTLPFGGSVVPSQVLARYGDGAEIELVWPEEQAGQTRIWSRSYGPDGAPKVLYVRRDPVAAIALGDSTVEALFGTTLVSIPLSGQGQPSEWRLTPPDQGAEAWTVAALPGGSPTVLARRGQELLCWWPPSPAPQAVIARDAGAATHLRLAPLHRPDAARRRVYAIWVDPERGIQRRAVR